MGEMADFLNDQQWDDDGSGLPIPRPPRVIKHPICRHCSKKALRWRQIGERWVLFEKNGRLHKCLNHPVPLDVLKKLAEETIREQRKKK